MHKQNKAIPPKPFICNVCEVGFKFRKQLNRHKHLHRRIRVHVCIHCDLGFEHKHEYIYHMRKNRHMVCRLCIYQKFYICNICDFHFTTDYARKKHAETEKCHKKRYDHKPCTYNYGL